MMEVSQEQQNNASFVDPNMRITQLIADMNGLMDRLKDFGEEEMRQVYDDTVLLSYNWAELSDILCTLKNEYDRRVFMIVDDGASVARAERIVNAEPIGHLVNMVRMKLKGVEKFLSNMKDKKRALENQAYNQY
jgi:hypothetical protein